MIDYLGKTEPFKHVFNMILFFKTVWLLGKYGEERASSLGFTVGIWWDGSTYGEHSLPNQFSRGKRAGDCIANYCGFL